MSLGEITLFGNIFLDNEERFVRACDSFISMRGVNFNKIIINIRGSFARKFEDFIHTNSFAETTVYRVESGSWFYDSLKLTDKIDSEYTLVWLEDMICMSSDDVNNAVTSMCETSSDILMYTFWNQGKYIDRYRNVDLLSHDFITFLTTRLKIINLYNKTRTPIL